MSALIEIRKELIGTENTHSVDAREMYKQLDIKKDFSNWIKHQISSLGLDENIDYLILAQKGEGRGYNKIDYIITLDTAKHIAMASRTEKGKEVRKYFIEAEKKLNQLHPQESSLLPAIIEMAKVNQQIVQSNQEIVANLTNMNAGLHEMLSTIHNIKHDTSKIKEEVKQIDAGFLMQHVQMKKIRESQSLMHPTLLDTIRVSVTDRAKELSNGTVENTQSITRAIYSYLNNEFNVPTYYYINHSDFGKAMDLINNINIGVNNAN